MKRFISLLIALIAGTGITDAQPGYDIKINLKGCKDTTLYLVKYVFDKQYMADTCKKVKRGAAEFKGTEPLEKGLYLLVNPEMFRYFDFLVNESGRFTINASLSDLAASMKSPDSRENELLFSYARFMTSKEQEYKKIPSQTKNKNKQDSLDFVRKKQKEINAEVKLFSEDFLNRNKGSFVADFLNLRVEKFAKVVPKASNGRPDSLFQYYYYKSHYLDGINFKDDRLLHVSFFADRVEKYLSEVIIQQPDTLIHELDKILQQCVPGSQLYTALLGHFAYTYEQDKRMSFDRNGKATTYEKVFVHLSDAYITNGKADGIYSADMVEKIGARVNIVRNLLPESVVSELFMVDTTDGRRVLNMGFDTARTSKSVTAIYYKNIEKLTPLFKTLYQVKAKYTVLVFWAVDCDHCREELPILNEAMKALKGKVDVQVFAVQTKDELFDAWRKFVSDQKLDFINVFDPVHVNNIKERFDITSTPMIYLLDQEKKIKGKRLTVEQVTEIIKNLESIEKL